LQRFPDQIASRQSRDAMASAVSRKDDLVIREVHLFSNV
jgi:hypothetical protein